MAREVSLRDVSEGDLSLLYEHQADPVAAGMAAFPSRDRDAFMTHWAKLMVNDTVTKRTILFRDGVAGNIVSFDREGHREVGYWIGREHWGKGIATAALTEFLEIETARPLYAYVAKHNIASTRVLQKCGFTIRGDCRGPLVPGGEEIEDYILILG
jgi:RimJ/RimL family protein N-acetyltransferase